MANSIFKHILLGTTLCAGATLLLNSCMDDSYDIDKVDLTMKLRTDGLGAPLGNTEKIMLDDILDIDDSEVKTDKSHLYYLVESGSTHFNVKVDKVSTTFKDARLEMTYNVVDYDKVKTEIERQGTTIPAGTPLPIDPSFSYTGHAEGEQAIDFNIKNIHDVNYVQSIQVSPTPIVLKLYKKNSSANVKLGINKIQNLVISIPKVLKVTGYDTNKWTLVEATGNATHHLLKQKNAETYNDANEITLCQINLQRVDLNREVNGSEIKLTGEEANMKLNGQVTFGSNSSSRFEMHEGDYASVRLEVKVGNNNQLTAEKVTGKFAPAIEPKVDPINISESLPDFLKDDEVTIAVTNPTLRFKSDFANIPVGVNLSGDLTSVYTNGTANVTKSLPNTSMDAKQQNKVYYYDGNNPYDPEEDANVYTDKAKVTNLGDLIKKIPDNITVDLGNKNNKKVSVKQNIYEIELGKNYQANADYSVFVPFEFKGGLQIVYNDSTSSMHSDLKKYKANKGQIIVTGEALNTIPLNLKVIIKAHDVDGKELPINFTEANVLAGTGNEADEAAVKSNIELVGTLTEDGDLSKIDKIFFKVRAASDNATESNTLVSTQWLKLNNIKLKLKADVTADFN